MYEVEVDTYEVVEKFSTRAGFILSKWKWEMAEWIQMLVFEIADGAGRVYLDSMEIA